MSLAMSLMCKPVFTTVDPAPTFTAGATPPLTTPISVASITGQKASDFFGMENINKDGAKTAVSKKIETNFQKFLLSHRHQYH